MTEKDLRLEPISEEYQRNIQQLVENMTFYLTEVLESGQPFESKPDILQSTPFSIKASVREVKPIKEDLAQQLQISFTFLYEEKGQKTEVPNAYVILKVFVPKDESQPIEVEGSHLNNTFFRNISVGQPSLTQVTKLLTPYDEAMTQAVANWLERETKRVVKTHNEKVENSLKVRGGFQVTKETPDNNGDVEYQKVFQPQRVFVKQ